MRQPPVFLFRPRFTFIMPRHTINNRISNSRDATAAIFTSCRELRASEGVSTLWAATMMTSNDKLHQKCTLKIWKQIFRWFYTRVAHTARQIAVGIMTHAQSHTSPAKYPNDESSRRWTETMKEEETKSFCFVHWLLWSFPLTRTPQECSFVSRWKSIFHTKAITHFCRLRFAPSFFFVIIFLFFLFHFSSLRFVSFLLINDFSCNFRMSAFEVGLINSVFHTCSVHRFDISRPTIMFTIFEKDQLIQLNSFKKKIQKQMPVSSSIVQY